jgi:hypothetical protein
MVNEEYKNGNDGSSIILSQAENALNLNRGSADPPIHLSRLLTAIRDAYVLPSIAFILCLVF